MAASAVLVASSAAPAAAAAHAPSCYARGGHTLAANTVVRLYTTGRPRHQRLLACRYRGGRNVLLDRILRNGREFSPYGVNGSRVFWVQQMSARQRGFDPTLRTVEVSVWDATHPTHLSTAGAIGFVWRSAVMNPVGRVAAIADPDGRDPGGPSSEVEVYDPAVDATDAAQPLAIQTVATAPTGTITDLAATSGDIIWRQLDGLHNAPFALPNGP